MKTRNLEAITFALSAGALIAAVGAGGCSGSAATTAGQDSGIEPFHLSFDASAHDGTAGHRTHSSDDAGDDDTGTSDDSSEDDSSDQDSTDDSSDEDSTEDDSSDDGSSGDDSGDGGDSGDDSTETTQTTESTSTPPPPTPPAVHCTAPTGAFSEQEALCTCDATAGEGAAHYTGEVCGEGNPFLCCASSGYPDSGGSCSCYSQGAWRCYSPDSEICTCGFSTKTTGTASTCNNAPGSDGNPWVCCLDRAGGNCVCQEVFPGVSFSCGAFPQVANCASEAALGVEAPLSSCPSGQKVSTCSSGLAGTCVSDDDCPGGCEGSDGPICCSVCSATGGNNGTCTVSCTE